MTEAEPRVAYKTVQLDVFQRLIEGQLLLVEGRLTDDQILGLAHSNGQSMLVAALDLIDYKDVTRSKLPNGRIIFQVGSK